MNLTNLWNRAIKHSVFNRSVDGAPGAMRQAVRPFGQPRSAPPQPCPVRRGARACLALLAAAALLALAAPAQAQTEVWTATLTPADLSGGILGCSNSVSTARCSSTSVLSEDSFNYDSTDYNITALLLRPDGQFELQLDAELTTNTAADLTLVVGSTSLVLADGDIAVQTRIWSSSGVSLTSGTDIAVKLTASGSDEATTEAAVLVSNFGQAHVGSTAYASTRVVGTFMTGDSAATLTSIEFELFAGAGIALPSATLYTGSVSGGERPDTLPVLTRGTMVATLTAPSTTLTVSKQLVTYTTTTSLAASTFYLVVLEITGTLTGFNEVAYGSVDTGEASGWTIGGWASGNLSPYFYRTDHTLKIRVNGTTVGTATTPPRRRPPPPPGDVVGYLENPGAASFQSGIGVISGWVCDAEEVEIVLNGEPQEAAYGTARLDTEAVCGDSDNGFGLLFNWNLLGDGEHEVVALVDGVELDRATVTVTTLGTEFLRDVTGTCTAADFPTGDETVTLAWQQTQQNFVIAEGAAPAGANRAGTPGVGYLENPGTQLLSERHRGAVGLGV